MSGLPIRAVAEQTGLAAGTIRMWEQRYGFPHPQRTSAGYRLYEPEDVELLRRVVELRGSGLSVPAALERARAGTPERLSIFGAVPHEGRSRRLRKRTLVALSRAIEDQAMVSAASPVVLGAFQRERHYRAVEHRYRRLAESAAVAAVFADFDAVRGEGDEPVEVPLDPGSAVGHEWAVVIDAPGFSVCLVAWEPPVAEAPASDLDREFDTFWTLDPGAVRRAAHAGAAVARDAEPAVGARIEAALDDREAAPGAQLDALEALAARMVAYMEDA